MIDIRLLREDLETVIKKLETRQADFSYLRETLKQDERRRHLIAEVEILKQERNEKSKLIGQLKRNKEDASEVMASVQDIGTQISKYDQEIKELEEAINHSLLMTPNILHESVPIGKDEKDNLEIRKYLKPKEFSFPVKTHYELGEALGILDFERASKITGSRFVVYKGMGARLERALISFMMDLHSNEHGYTEMLPPYIVNRESMTATGQLPKFEADAFRLAGFNDDWFLNPTAEVPSINYHRDEILKGDDLPLRYCSFTTAFRSEAGSAGRDTRGLIRTHQFNKVELIKFAKPEESYEELEKMILDSEHVLKLLEIPYRVVSLSSGDMGAAMAKTYDIEVWVPSQNTYREIGSISNAESYQARRGNMRFRRTKDSRPEFVHTLNGSGLAVGRCWVALVENYQREDGSIEIPKVLRPYMGIDEIK